VTAAKMQRASVVHEIVRSWLRRNRRLAWVTAGLFVVGVVAVGMADAGGGEGGLAILVLYLPASLGLLLMSGVVSADLDSRLILIWYTKPGGLGRNLVQHYFLHQLLIGGIGLLSGGVAAALALTRGVLPADQIVRLPALAVALAVLPAAMVFAFSAWGSRRDSALALITIVAGIGLGGAVVFDAGFLRNLIMAIVFPMDALQALGGAGPSADALVANAAILAAHLVAWTLLGVAGTRWLERTLHRSL